MTDPSSFGPGRPSLVAGLGGISGGLIAGTAVWFGAAFLLSGGQSRPDDLLGGTFALIGLLLIVSALSVIGFVIGSMAGAAIALVTLGHRRPASTIGLAILLDFAAVPGALWLMFRLGETDAPLWLVISVPVLLVGGVVPAVATGIIARRGLPASTDQVDRPPS